MSLPKAPWSKTDLNLIYRYKSRIKDIQKSTLQQTILSKDVNSIDFYNITPKQKLPKFLQKMKFQTLHSKQNAGRDVKVFREESESADEVSVRRKLKTAGNIMFLSQIYQSLGESLEPKPKYPFPLSSPKPTQPSFTPSDLQQWQKSRHAAIYQKLLLFKRRSYAHRKQSRIIQQKLSELHRRNTTGGVVNYFKQGSNYRKEIQKQLEIIYNKHSSEGNRVNMYVLVENSAKLLKKELDERGGIVEGEMGQKLKVLNELRIEHHKLFEQRTKLGLQQKHYTSQLATKQQQQLHATSTNSSSYFTTPTITKLTQLKALKRAQIDQIQAKILRNKRIIEQLQLGIQHCEEELTAIMVGQVTYYKMSLRVGLDCRDTGLGWILKRLAELQERRGGGGREVGKQAKESNFTSSIANHPQFAQKQQQYEFPLYLDRKSKQFLILKTNLQTQLQHLMQQKRKFVIEQICSGQSVIKTTQSQQSRLGLKNTISMSGLQTANTVEVRDRDRVEEEGRGEGVGNKRFRCSLNKSSRMNLQSVQCQPLLQPHTKPSPVASKKFQLTTNTSHLTGKQLYQTITQNLKSFDFIKFKKDKPLQLKNSKLTQYQTLLKSIKDIHNKLQELDSQHENHLVGHYKESKEVFFEQCAACFGYKRSHAMVVKYFSWKGKEGVVGEDNVGSV